MQLRARLVSLATAVLVTCGLVVVPPATAAHVVTPGNFTGYGFDQCLAPDQEAMDAWLRHSPFWAVGIYISGDSRYCREQPNLTPTWVDTQLANGWRLLPITLGPQAWCTTRDRYLRQERINPDPDNRYAKARGQGRHEAGRAVAAAQALGIAPGSTLWYDLEAFDIRPTHCRESALSFLSAWTWKLHDLGYVSGVYSSAGSGIKMLDDAQTNRPGRYLMPDRIWVARWSGTPNEINDGDTVYLRDTSWADHQRVHQYRGGHDETHGGVTINIDSNWVDLGRGTVAPRAGTYCGGVRLDFPSYPRVRPGSQGELVEAAQCLLRRTRLYTGEISGMYDAPTAAAARAYRASVGLPDGAAVGRAVWTSLHVRGARPLLKYGAGMHAVRRLQRALNAADGAGLAVTGVFEGRTDAAVRRYQADHGLRRTGVVLEPMWRLLAAGTR